MTAAEVKRALIIDDEESIRNYLRYLLEKAIRLPRQRTARRDLLNSTPVNLAW